MFARFLAVLFLMGFAGICDASCSTLNGTFASNPVGTIYQSCTAGSAGTPIVLQTSGATTVTAIPGGGGTILVEYTTSPVLNISAGTATWTAWPSGTVSATIRDVTNGPVTGIRQTPSTATGVLEIVQ